MQRQLGVVAWNADAGSVGPVADAASIRAILKGRTPNQRMQPYHPLVVRRVPASTTAAEISSIGTPAPPCAIELRPIRCCAAHAWNKNRTRSGDPKLHMFSIADPRSFG